MDAVLRVIRGEQGISQLVINETLKEPVGSLGSDQSWSTWLELPVVCILDHIEPRLEPKMGTNAAQRSAKFVQKRSHKLWVIPLKDSIQKLAILSG